MSLKLLTISFLLTSTLLSVLFIQTKLTKPIAAIRPLMNSIYFPKSNLSYPVTFAYLISASDGDAGRLKRLLPAIYHPGNHYLIHLDQGASAAEHREIAEFLGRNPVFRRVGNVWMVGKPSLVTYRGPTMLATTLHAMAILLRSCRWDWFINLSASDYPLVTQDGMVSENGCGFCVCFWDLKMIFAEFLWLGNGMCLVGFGGICLMLKLLKFLFMWLFRSDSCLL